MRLWCDRCCEAVDAVEHEHSEVMDRDVPNSIYRYSTYTCPYCGSEVYEEPSKCYRCGAETVPGDELCDCCYEDLNGVVSQLQENGKYSREVILDSLGRFLEAND